MADPDSQAQLRAASAANGKVALTGPVVANGRVAKRDSDEIVAEIERTRQSLARTIDTLADRVSPASNVKRLRERANEELRKARGPARHRSGRPGAHRDRDLPAVRAARQVLTGAFAYLPAYPFSADNACKGAFA